MDSNKFKNKFSEAVFIFTVGAMILALVLFCVFKLDNLMHSDTTAEVILSKLLADENKLITKNWFYSTEIRIVYSHLIMIPLFKIFSDYSLVKLISILIFYVLLFLSFMHFAKSYGVEKKWRVLGLALLFSPLSNEYLDMMFIGCFYTSQAICTFLVLSAVAKRLPKTANWEGEDKKRKNIISFILLNVFALILGLSGLRYIASLFLPMVLAVLWILYSQEENKKQESFFKDKWFGSLLKTGSLLVCSGVGFLINKFYLAGNYSFDTTSEVVFTELSNVADRFLNSFKLMIEFFGYYPVEVVSGRGIVNVIKLALFLFFTGVIVYLFKHRKDRLNAVQRFLLYYFLATFVLNWYMLIFTEVLMQYRYWIPVYIVAVLLVAVFFQIYEPKIVWHKVVFELFVAVAALSSLYGELWQDVKYNDCEKRYAYVEFLEENDYTFGYATFWNASVTEYLTNGEVEVGNLGGENGVSAPYEWLCKKDLYKEGYHSGKTFLLLAKTEEAGMLKGDFTVMPDGVKVYEDEYYAIYEGNGMYLFSE